MIRTATRVSAAAALLLAGYFIGQASAREVAMAQQTQQSGTRIFEMRTYTTPDAAQFEMLNARFRDHTRRIFDRHGMSSVGYWMPVDAPNTLIYILAHPSQEEAKKHWAEFNADPEWQKIRTETREKGLTGVKTESRFLQPTDYSAIK